MKILYGFKSDKIISFLGFFANKLFLGLNPISDYLYEMTYYQHLFTYSTPLAD